MPQLLRVRPLILAVMTLALAAGPVWFGGSLIPGPGMAASANASQGVPSQTPNPAPAGTVSPAPSLVAALSPSPGALLGATFLDRPEVRALWVDAFHDGFKTPAQVDELVAFARGANLNALYVQVRRRGDAYYSSTIEPRSEDAALQPGFDALNYLLQRAHQGPQRLQVHAWLAALPVWGSRLVPPVDPAHVLNQHGLDPTDPATWLMVRDDGEAWAGAADAGGMYYLDPGNPAAADYTAQVFLDLIRHYPVDGIHLDQIRYFEGSSGHWGYNPVSVARFNSRYGRDPGSQPTYDDPDWAAWRRDQVTALVRRIYLESKAIRPSAAVTTAVVTWGEGPRGPDGWLQTTPYASVFQDWRSWLQEGIVDYAVPMNYFREDSRQGTWFDTWATWEKANPGARGVVLGIGSYLNPASGAVAQAERARAGGTLGIALYSYAVPHQSDAMDSASLHDEALRWLRQLFPRPAQVPVLSWLDNPTLGNMLVQVGDREGATVRLTGPAARIWRTEANGVAGGTDLPAGVYDVSIDGAAVWPPTSQVVVAPGRTSTVRYAPGAVAS